jgi:serine/threonine protein kinase/tetratricopeptide (TPR) repeat protein
MGAVYAAHDAERATRVAIKTLLRDEDASVRRFKGEFRGLVDVRHPNLVQLHELFCEDGLWFYAMELIDGQPFDAWCRDRGTDRLRDGIAQLIAAVLAIHRAGKLHRDLKPSNVLVTAAGRVVVLDFGLAGDREQGDGASDYQGAGTPSYMAPEQAAGLPAVPASDAYAIGSMLFEVLTGRLPFEGPLHACLLNKQWLNPPALDTVLCNAPADLARLCDALLQRNPERRPSLTEAASWLHFDVEPALDSPRPRVTEGDPPHKAGLFGREPELEVLRRAYVDSLASPTPLVMLVSGESGVGKSALLHDFLETLRDEDGKLLALSGRSFERETVPFKAFDVINEHLGRYLRNRHVTSPDALVTRDEEALGVLFPSLARARTEAPDPHAEDAVKLRRRAFTSFTELLSRIGRERRLVLHFDDFQWSDVDSLLLLLHVVRNATAPSLIVVAHRSEQRDRHPLLTRLYRELPERRDALVRELVLGPLSLTAARAMLAHDAVDIPPEVLATAGGNPMWLRELARHEALGAESIGPSLRAKLDARIRALPPEERCMLQVLAIAGGPIAMDVAASAADTRSGPRALFESLRMKSLARSTGEGALLECSHDQVREVLVDRLPLEQRVELHRRLAQALAATPSPDPEQLAAHLLEAGERADAVAKLIVAAERARLGLGFERAARLYTQALRIRRALGGAEDPDLWRALALAEQFAGRPLAAADAWQQAARISSEPLDSIRAAESLWGTGSVAAGRAAVEPALRTVGLSLQRSLAVSLALGWYWRRRAHAVKAPCLPTDEARGRVRLELCFAAASALGANDPMASYGLQGRALYEAKRSGQPRDLVRALGTELLYVGASGRREVRRAGLKQQLVAAAAQVRDPELSSFAELSIGYEQFVRGELRQALPSLEHARQSFEQSRSLGWQSKMAARGLAWVLWLRGHYMDFRALVPQLIGEAREMGDQLTCDQQSCLFTHDSLLRDDGDEATRVLCELRRGLRRGAPSGTEFLLERAQWQLAIYLGDHSAAHAATRRYSRKWLPLTHFFVTRLDLAWFASVQRLAHQPGSAPVARTHATARKLLREQLGWAHGLGYALRAAAFARDSREAEAAHAYRQAASALEEAGFDAQAEAARLQSAHLLGDRDDVRSFEDRLRTRGVVNLARWLRIMMPGPSHEPHP